MAIQRTPTHPNVVTVDFKVGPGYNSKAKAARPFKAGETICKLDGITRAPKAYTSVQCGPDESVELNSDLAYINHSCEPNIAFDLSSTNRKEWHIRAVKDISAGDDFTYFYPSTEWSMVQPFSCTCHAPTCLGFIKGASVLSQDELLARGFINPFIWDLVGKRERGRHL